MNVAVLRTDNLLPDPKIKYKTVWRELNSGRVLQAVSCYFHPYMDAVKNCPNAASTIKHGLDYRVTSSTSRYHFFLLGPTRALTFQPIDFGESSIIF